MLNRILKYLGIAWMVIIFVFVPIAYTALLFASDAEINMCVPKLFRSLFIIIYIQNIQKSMIILAAGSSSCQIPIKGKKYNFFFDI